MMSMMPMMSSEMMQRSVDDDDDGDVDGDIAMVTVVLMMMMMVTMVVMVTVVTCDMMQEPVDQEIPAFPPPTHRLHDRQYIAKYAKYAVHNMQCKLDNIM